MASATVTPAVPKGTAAALQLVKCKVSASLLPGNLVAGTKSYAYIHRSEVALVESRLVALGTEKADTIKSAYAEKEPVNQIEFVKLAPFGEVLVVVNQAGGVFLYDESGQKLLHSYKHTKASGALTLKEAHLRGIASDGKESLYVGTGTGDILALHVTKAKITLAKLLAASPDSHQENSAQGGGVSALAYNTQHSILASADDWGNVLLWSVASGDALGASKAVRAWSGAGSPVCVMAQGHGMLVAGFGSGHVRMFDLAKKGIVVEIAAHTRAINSVDVHASKPIVLAAAEDTFVSVWSLPTPGAAQPQVKSLYTESPVLGLITGCRFGGSHGELIVTSSYDSRSLAIMHTP